VFFQAAVNKRLPDFTIDITLGLDSGDFLALVGPSGGGKTTILRIIAGLDRPDSAKIICNNQVWVDTSRKIALKPAKRNVGYVFQDYVLFPHLSVEKNVAFGARNWENVSILLELFGIDNLRNRRPHQISGGERQRTALAQAIAREPKILFLDEPFSALDPHTKERLRSDLLMIKEKFSFPVIHITHDHEEAKMVADKIVPVVDGKVDFSWFRQSVDETNKVKRSRQIDQLKTNDLVKVNPEFIDSGNLSRVDVSRSPLWEAV